MVVLSTSSDNGSDSDSGSDTDIGVAIGSSPNDESDAGIVAWMNSDSVTEDSDDSDGDTGIR